MGSPWFIDNMNILFRLLAAMLMGGLIGWERERSSHAAGLRTHILVCVGSALIMMLSVYGFADFIHETNVRIDPARLATAVISGIGFLGAGTILFTGKAITGLTTAASLWVVAAIGLAIGAGFYFAAFVTTLLVLLNLWVLNIVEQRYIRRSKAHAITIEGISGILTLERVSKFLYAENITIKRITFIKERSGHTLSSDTLLTELRMNVEIHHEYNPMDIISRMQKIDGVTAVSIE
ncbi:MgtC/SapB family protein [Paenibacillus bovis]|uniref:Magnesium transporter MgtC n=1 Tax=Paenibacillus bovis TaxID=1616788 RepID=A0A172ZMW8_9BACL|nr:MgtC/SapB family protein [Paenibacillus bovis]ANF98938.1 magnesium transporter MgtC [Paenibacillus bovis]